MTNCTHKHTGSSSPGGRGTASMVKLATEAGVHVHTVTKSGPAP